MASMSEEEGLEDLRWKLSGMLDAACTYISRISREAKRMDSLKMVVAMKRDKAKTGLQECMHALHVKFASLNKEMEEQLNEEFKLRETKLREIKCTLMENIRETASHCSKIEELLEVGQELDLENCGAMVLEKMQKICSQDLDTTAMGLTHLDFVSNVEDIILKLSGPNALGYIQSTSVCPSALEIQLGDGSQKLVINEDTILIILANHSENENILRYLSVGLLLPDRKFHDLKIDNSETGVYTVGFTPRNIGMHSIHVKLYGTHVEGSPLPVIVHAKRVDVNVAETSESDEVDIQSGQRVRVCRNILNAVSRHIGSNAAVHTNTATKTPNIPLPQTTVDCAIDKLIKESEKSTFENDLTFRREKYDSGKFANDGGILNSDKLNSSPCPMNFGDKPRFRQVSRADLSDDWRRDRHPSAEISAPVLQIPRYKIPNMKQEDSTTEEFQNEKSRLGAQKSPEKNFYSNSDIESEGKQSVSPKSKPISEQALKGFKFDWKPANDWNHEKYVNLSDTAKNVKSESLSVSEYKAPEPTGSPSFCLKPVAEKLQKDIAPDDKLLNCGQNQSEIATGREFNFGSGDKSSTPFSTTSKTTFAVSKESNFLSKTSPFKSVVSIGGSSQSTPHKSLVASNPTGTFLKSSLDLVKSSLFSTAKEGQYEENEKTNSYGNVIASLPVPTTEKIFTFGAPQPVSLQNTLRSSSVVSSGDDWENELISCDIPPGLNQTSYTGSKNCQTFTDFSTVPLDKRSESFLRLNENNNLSCSQKSSSISPPLKNCTNQQSGAELKLKAPCDFHLSEVNENESTVISKTENNYCDMKEATHPLKNLILDSLLKNKGVLQLHVKLQFGKKGSGVANVLKFPIGVTVSQQKSVIVCDNGNSLVKLFSWDGVHQFSIGDIAGETFKRPSAVVTTKTELFVKDDRQIQAFDINDGTFLRAFGKGILTRPYGLVLTPEGNILTLDENKRNPRLVVFAPDGKLMHELPYEPLLNDNIHRAKCRFLALWKDQLFVVDLGKSLIYVTNLLGKLLNIFGGFGDRAGQFREPSGISTDCFGNILIADSRNNRVQLFGTDGVVKCIVELDSEIIRPSDIHLTDDGHLLVVNYLSHCVKVFSIIC